MKALFIGGTGLISSACVERALEGGWDLSLLNRGVSKKYPVPPGARLLQGDVHGDPEALQTLLRGQNLRYGGGLARLNSGIKAGFPIIESQMDIKRTYKYSIIKKNRDCGIMIN